MRFAWLTGWATSPQATQRLAEGWCPGEHHIVVPNARWQSDIEPFVDEETILCGYSTGAYLLLRQRKFLERARRVLLFAPFLHLTAEAKLGGRADEKVLGTWLSGLPAQRERTLSTFRRWVRLPRDPEVSGLSLEELEWGLRELLEGPAAPAPPTRTEAWVGSRDPLVDAPELARHVPQLSVVQGAGHALFDLLAAVPQVEG